MTAISDSQSVNHEFIYLLADDGVWILSEPDDQPLNSVDSSAYGG